MGRSEYERGREAGLAEAAVLLEKELNWWRNELASGTNGGQVIGGIRTLLSRMRHLQNIMTYEMAEVVRVNRTPVERDDLLAQV